MTASKIVVRQNLTDSAPRPTGWLVTSLEDRGEEALSRLMVLASDGKPYDTSTDEAVLDDLHELVLAAGKLFNPQHWFAIADDLGDFGVVLPQVFPDEPTTGTLFYLAVVPDRRGEGLGGQIHRFGLSEPKKRGASRDVGSTATENLAMISIFRANGCELDPKVKAVLSPAALP